MPLSTVNRSFSIDDLTEVSLAMARRKLMPLYIFIGVAGAIALVVGSINAAFSGDVSLVVVAVALLAYTACLPSYFRWKVRKRLSDPKNAAFFIPSQYEIDEETLHVRDDAGATSSIPWTSIVEVQPWRDGYLLMLNEFMFHLFLPSRFATSEEWDEFTRLALRRPQGKRVG